SDVCSSDLARGEVRVERLAAFAADDLSVIARGDPDEHAGTAAVERCAGLAGMLERFPRHFEQQPMLRIELNGLARSDPEESRVEPIDLVQKTALLGGDLAGGLRVGIVVGIGVPAVGGDLADGVDTARQQAPERLGIVDSAWEPTADPDDGDRLGAG